MTFILILQLCSAMPASCQMVAVPSSFATYEDCRQSFGASTKLDKNALEVRSFACVIGSNNQQVATK